MSGHALIKMIRDFHRDCGGCPVEQMCDEYEALLDGHAILLTAEQSDEMRSFLGRIVNHPGIFGPAHDIHDEAFVYMPLFPLATPPRPGSEPPQTDSGGDSV